MISPQAGEPVLRFELPEQASNLSVQESLRLRYLQLEDGFGIGSVRPANEPYEVTFAYEMPYEKGKLDLALPLPVDTMAAIIIAPESGVKVRGSQLQSSGSRDFQGVSYSTYTTDNLTAGEILQFTLSGHPKSQPNLVSTWEGKDSSSLIVGLGAFGVVLIVVGVYLWRQNRLHEPEWAKEGIHWDEDGYAGGSPEELMDAIIALDDLYQEGDIPERATRNAGPS